MLLRAKNWRDFQHYSDRSPGWIKLHRRLLDDRVFQRLPDASRALAPMIWLLCSESEDGSIKDAIVEIAFRLRMTEQKVEAGLNPLIEAGFFIVEQDASDMGQSASTPLADGEQDACLEKRREETEKRERQKTCFDSFVLAAGKNGWPKPNTLSPDRRKRIQAILTEHGDAAWTTMLEKAATSTLFKKKFPLTIDWALEPKNFRKIIEGNYDARAPDAPGLKFN